MVGCSEDCSDVAPPVFVEAAIDGLNQSTVDSALYLCINPSTFAAGFKIEHVRVFPYEVSGCAYKDSAPIPDWIPGGFLDLFPMTGFGGSLSYLDAADLTLRPALTTITTNGCSGDASYTGYVLSLSDLLTAAGDDGTFYDAYNSNFAPCCNVLLIYLHLVSDDGEESYAEVQLNCCF